MGNNDIKVKDLSTTSSLSTDNKLMLLTDEANNRVQNITVENALANIISSNANNSLSIGTDKKLYTPDISGEVGDLDNLITTNKTNIVSAINEVKGDTNAITGAVVPASKGWLEEGEIYQKANWYGEKLYNDVYKYNHSTNVTGIDTIKPADYTVVGTPTINADGIASGFSASNYLTKDLNLSGSTLKIKVPFNVTNVTKTQQLINNSNFQLRLLYVSGNTALYPSLYVTDGVNTIQPRTSTYALQANTDYVVEIEYKHNVSVDIKLYSASGVLLDSLHSTSSATTSAVIPNSVLTTKIGSSGGSDYLEGSIDLCGVRIEADFGVYRPILQIPYNLSSTGSKIVDVAYRDRVIDVFEQYGSANYYTIDETNQNATLPMGEIYGLIRQADSDKIYKDLVPCYDSTKAISVPLLGNYTAPADGYVCSPNMVLTLDPDNGYENFSLTIMRNTQSMTMISCTGPTAFPFCLPVLKDDVLTLAADATVTSNVYFIPREGV